MTTQGNGSTPINNKAELAIADFFESEWNRPGRFVRGPLYKATTTNLAFMVLGLLFVIVALFQTHSTVTTSDEHGNHLSCGSVASPKTPTSMGESYSNSLGYSYAGTGNSNSSFCSSVISSKSGAAFTTRMTGFIMIGGALAIALLRKPQTRAWGTLSKRKPGKGGSEPKPQPVASGPASPPAGWYPDQADPQLVRWFDGSTWTAATLPRSDQS